MARLRRAALRLARDPEDARDLVQETLCRAWASWHRFEHQGRTGAYLVRVLTNTFISQRRREAVASAARRGPDLAAHLHPARDRGSHRDPEPDWQRRILSGALRRRIGQLPDHQRAVAELVDLQGLSYQETADRLQIPAGTVMSRLHRARRALRAQAAAMAPLAAAG